MRAFIELFVLELKDKRYNANFTEAMIHVLDPECGLHKRHFEISDEDLQKMKTVH